MKIRHFAALTVLVSGVCRAVAGCVLLWLAAGCQVLHDKAKYGFTNGVYRSNAFGPKNERVYVATVNDTVQVYLLDRQGHSWIVGRPARRQRAFMPSLLTNTPAIKGGFSTSGFDVDFLTVPFKYRPAAGLLPRQFNTNFNGLVYAGCRTDRYRLGYEASPVGLFHRQITHYALSVGGFTGLGSTAMNAYVTNNQLNTEYDGLLWLKGLAVIVGVNNVTLGMALGYDHLLDANRRHWIYQHRPWLGLTFGLNLN